MSESIQFVSPGGLVEGSFARSSGRAILVTKAAPKGEIAVGRASGDYIVLAPEGAIGGEVIYQVPETGALTIEPTGLRAGLCIYVDGAAMCLAINQ